MFINPWTEATTVVLWKKVFLKISQNSQESTFARVSFLIKLQALGLQLYEKRDSGVAVFLWILRNFPEHHFYITPPDDCFFLEFALWFKSHEKMQVNFVVVF